MRCSCALNHAALAERSRLPSCAPPSFTWRGLENVGFVLLLALALLTLFAGYPLLDGFLRPAPSVGFAGAFGMGGVNASGQVPQSVTSRLTLVDPDTPQEAYTKWGVYDSTEPYDLVWSDEFEADGRSFYPGDDRAYAHLVLTESTCS